MDILYKLSVKKNTGVLFQNYDDLNVFLKRGLVNSSRVKKVNGSGVNLKTYDYQPVKESSITFLFVGRLLKDKGISEFLEAAKIIKRKYPHVQFHVVGPYDSNPTSISKRYIDSLVEQKIIDYFGKKEDVRPFYIECSVFVLPSYHEGTPRTNLEAMATGRPIITTNAPGCKETIIHKKNGLMVEVGSVSDLVKSCEFFILNPSKINEMGIESRRIASKNFDVHKVNKEIINYILGDEISEANTH